MLGSATTEHLLIEPIVGWRAWYLPPGTERLHSPRQGTPWRGAQLRWDGRCRCGSLARVERIEQATQAIAQLDKSELRREPVQVTTSDGSRTYVWGATQLRSPQLARTLREVHERGHSCHCGINAFRDAEQLDDTGWPHAQHMLLGRVALSGVVREFEHGWRAEHGQVLDAWSTSSTDVQRAVQACALLGIEYRGVWADAPR